MSDQGEKYNPLKYDGHVHSEQQLEKAAIHAMACCAETIAMMRGDLPNASEAQRREALDKLNRAMQEIVPDITLVEMAHVALFIALKFHPLSGDDIQKLDSLAEESKVNRDLIKARIAKRHR
jgi:hypothetical protein